MFTRTSVITMIKRQEILGQDNRKLYRNYYRKLLTPKNYA